MKDCNHVFYKTEDIKFDEQLNVQIVKLVCNRCGKIKWVPVNTIFEEHKYDKNHSIVDGY